MSLLLWASYLTVGAIYIYGSFDNKINFTDRFGDFCRLLLAPILLIIYIYLTNTISYWVIASLILTGLAYSFFWQQLKPSLIIKAFYLLAAANICWSVFFALKINIGSVNISAGILLIVFSIFGYLQYLITGKRKLLRQKAVILCGITGLITGYLASGAYFTVVNKSLLVGFCGSLALLLSYTLHWWPKKNQLLQSCGALSLIIAYMYLILGSLT